MRRARSVRPARERSRAAISFATAGSSLSGTCASRSRMAPSAAVRGAASGSSAAARKIERLRDGAQHADRRIAGAALDLRQIALGGCGGLRQLAARHAALGAVSFAPRARWRRESRRLRGVALRNAAGFRGSLLLRLGHRLSSPPRDCRSCTIVHYNGPDARCRLAGRQLTGNLRWAVWPLPLFQPQTVPCRRCTRHRCNSSASSD